MGTEVINNIYHLVFNNYLSKKLLFQFYIWQVGADLYGWALATVVGMKKMLHIENREHVESTPRI